MDRQLQRSSGLDWPRGPHKVINTSRSCSISLGGKVYNRETTTGSLWPDFIVALLPFLSTFGAVPSGSKCPGTTGVVGGLVPRRRCRTQRNRTPPQVHKAQRANKIPTTRPVASASILFCSLSIWSEVCSTCTSVTETVRSSPARSSCKLCCRRLVVVSGCAKVKRCSTVESCASSTSKNFKTVQLFPESTCQ